MPHTTSGALGRPTKGTAWEDTAASQLEDPYVPGKVRMPEGVAVVQVVAGGGFTCALTEDGSVYGWGLFKDEVTSDMHFTPNVKLQRLPALVYQPELVRDRVVKLAAGEQQWTQQGVVL